MTTNSTRPAPQIPIAKQEDAFSRAIIAVANKHPVNPDHLAKDYLRQQAGINENSLPIVMKNLLVKWGITEPGHQGYVVLVKSICQRAAIKLPREVLEKIPKQVARNPIPQSPAAHPPAPIPQAPAAAPLPVASAPAAANTSPSSSPRDPDPDDLEGQHAQIADIIEARLRESPINPQALSAKAILGQTKIPPEQQQFAMSSLIGSFGIDKTKPTAHRELIAAIGGCQSPGIIVPDEILSQIP